MKVSYILFTAFSTVYAAVGVIKPHDDLSLSPRHMRVARHASAISRSIRSTTKTKRCKSRSKGKESKSDTSPKPSEKSDGITSSQKSQATPKGAVATSGSILKASSPVCGDSGATKQVTATSGPNGNIDWLNCGITGGGWNPPHITVNDVITIPLPEAVKSPDSPFQACKDYVPLFEKYGNEFGIPSIMLASFAMQESTCNAGTVGGGGEQGLMQITPEKCGDAPNGNCKDPDFNIRTGAKYFADTLASNNGDLLVTLGNYNGWFRKMTENDATAAAHSGCCTCQRNLDYLHQFLNGWCQNINAYDHHLRLGQFFNLDICLTL